MKIKNCFLFLVFALAFLSPGISAEQTDQICHPKLTQSIIEAVLIAVDYGELDSLPTNSTLQIFNSLGEGHSSFALLVEKHGSVYRKFTFFKSGEENDPKAVTLEILGDCIRLHRRRVPLPVDFHTSGMEIANAKLCRSFARLNLFFLFHNVYEKPEEGETNRFGQRTHISYGLDPHQAMVNLAMKLNPFMPETSGFLHTPEFDNDSLQRLCWNRLLLFGYHRAFNEVFLDKKFVDSVRFSYSYNDLSLRRAFQSFVPKGLYNQITYRSGVVCMTDNKNGGLHYFSLVGSDNYHQENIDALAGSLQKGALAAGRYSNLLQVYAEEIARNYAALYQDRLFKGLFDKSGRPDLMARVFVSGGAVLASNFDDAVQGMWVSWQDRLMTDLYNSAISWNAIPNVLWLSPSLSHSEEVLLFIEKICDGPRIRWWPKRKKN